MGTESSTPSIVALIEALLPSMPTMYCAAVIFPATRAGTSKVSFTVTVPVVMRAAPSYSALAGGNDFATRGGGDQESGLSAYSINLSGNSIYMATDVSFVPDSGSAYVVWVSASGNYLFDAEL